MENIGGYTLDRVYFIREGLLEKWQLSWAPKDEGASWRKVWKTRYLRWKEQPVQRPWGRTELVTFKNLKMTKVAGILGRVGKKGLWHEMRPERWQGPHCAKFWVYPRSNRNAHSSLSLKYSKNTFWLFSYHSSNCNSQVIDLFPPLSCDILGDRGPYPNPLHLSNTAHILRPAHHPVWLLNWRFTYEASPALPPASLPRKGTLCGLRAVPKSKEKRGPSQWVVTCLGSWCRICCVPA